MRRTNWYVVRPLVVLVTLVLSAGNGRADYIASTTGVQGLGSFSGTIDYNAVNAHSATLTIELQNTSPSANGGYLTAFAFDNPSDRITGAKLSSTNTNFSLLGAPHFQGGISAPPYGSFDLGATTGGKFQGSGSPTGGIGVGQSATFTFTLTGNDLDKLSAASFLSNPASCGSDMAPFVARFRGFKCDGCDTVPGVPVSHAPEPGGMTLAAIALMGLMGYGWWSRRRTEFTPECA
jgi:hypothetical protein